eukprot:3383002-Pleurochrysis_carterae.AAC.2
MLACVVVVVNKELLKEVLEIQKFGRVVEFSENGVPTPKVAVWGIRCVACGLGLGPGSQPW